MKKNTYFLLGYACGWLILIDAMAIIININEDLLRTEIADYLVCAAMLFFPIAFAWFMTNMKIKKCRGKSNGEDQNQS